MAKAEAKGVKLLLPIDTVVADGFPSPIDAEIAVSTVDSTSIPDGKMGLDIGEKACAEFAAAAKAAKTVVWNGPMGVFENPTLAAGTIAVAEALAAGTIARWIHQYHAGRKAYLLPGYIHCRQAGHPYRGWKAEYCSGWTIY